MGGTILMNKENIKVVLNIVGIEGEVIISGISSNVSENEAIEIAKEAACQIKHSDIDFIRIEKE
jgi:hypothetical protein